MLINRRNNGEDYGGINTGANTADTRRRAPVTPSVGEDGGKVLLYMVLRYAGLAGVFLFAVSFLLGSRFPSLERCFGQDRLLRQHHWLGVFACVLALGHGGICCY